MMTLMMPLMMSLMMPSMIPTCETSAIPSPRRPGDGSLSSYRSILIRFVVDFFALDAIKQSNLTFPNKFPAAPQKIVLLQIVLHIVQYLYYTLLHMVINFCFNIHILYYWTYPELQQLSEILTLMQELQSCMTVSLVCRSPTTTNPSPFTILISIHHFLDQFFGSNEKAWFC